jgi:hypothetical protein
MVGGEQIRELHFETAHEIPAPPILRKGEKGKISRSAMMTGQAEKKTERKQGETVGTAAGFPRLGLALFFSGPKRRGGCR